MIFYVLFFILDIDIQTDNNLTWNKRKKMIIYHMNLENSFWNRLFWNLYPREKAGGPLSRKCEERKTAMSLMYVKDSTTIESVSLASESNESVSYHLHWRAAPWVYRIGSFRQLYTTYSTGNIEFWERPLKCEELMENFSYNSQLNQGQDSYTGREAHASVWGVWQSL